MKFFLAAVLTVATLIAVGTLVSAVHWANHGATHASVTELTQRAA
jgi:hypothetical protein